MIALLPLVVLCGFPSLSGSTNTAIGKSSRVTSTIGNGGVTSVDIEEGTEDSSVGSVPPPSHKLERLTKNDGSSFLAYVENDDALSSFYNHGVSRRTSEVPRRAKKTGKGKAKTVPVEEEEEEPELFTVDRERAPMKKIAQFFNLCTEQIEVKTSVPTKNGNTVAVNVNVLPFSSQTMQVEGEIDVPKDQPNQTRRMEKHLHRQKADSFCFKRGEHAQITATHEKKCSDGSKADASCWKLLPDDPTTEVIDCFSGWSPISDVGWPYGSPLSLDPDQTEAYVRGLERSKLAKDYRRLTGREYVLPYHRNLVVHQSQNREEEQGGLSSEEEEGRKLFVWPSTYDGQVHQVEAELIPLAGSETLETKKMKLEAIAPRVFQVSSFVSDNEIQHLLEHASLESDEQDVDGPTHLDRDASTVVDRIYRRVADTLRIDVPLLRHDSCDRKGPEDGELQIAADPLRVERITVPTMATKEGDDSPFLSENEIRQKVLLKEDQYTTVATVVLYLSDKNGDQETRQGAGDAGAGGEVVFPYIVHPEEEEVLTVMPEKGKAIIYYSILPDGNHDVHAQHEVVPPLSAGNHEDGGIWMASLRLFDATDYDKISHWYDL